MYSVLLLGLYEAGVNGKVWRLLRSWYDGAIGYVRSERLFSGSFKISRGESISRYCHQLFFYSLWILCCDNWCHQDLVFVAFLLGTM